MSSALVRTAVRARVPYDVVASRPQELAGAIGDSNLENEALAEQTKATLR